MIYFTVSRAGDICHIGHSTDLAKRMRQNNNSGMKLVAAICGSETNEHSLHSHFKELAVSDAEGEEIFHLSGELKNYLEWLGTRAWAATCIEELGDTYPAPGRFPWEIHGVRVGEQPKLDLFDQIVPGLRKPRSRSERIKTTLYSDSDEWFTPGVYIEAARRVMGSIDLDPASCPLANLTVGAERIYTRTEDGLRYDWHGNIWLNPPYGNEKDRFVDHLLAEHAAGRVDQAVMCLNAHATDTVWFQPLWAYPVCLTHHRPRFVGGVKGRSAEEVAPTTGIAFVYVGPNSAGFTHEFREFGPILRCETPAATTAEEFRRRQAAGDDWNTGEAS